MESNVYQKENTRYKAAESGKTFHVDDVEDDDDQGDSGRCGVGEGDVCAHEQAICQTPHVITTTVTHCASTEQTFLLLYALAWSVDETTILQTTFWKFQKRRKIPPNTEGNREHFVNRQKHTQKSFPKWWHFVFYFYPGFQSWPASLSHDSGWTSRDFVRNR